VNTQQVRILPLFFNLYVLVFWIFDCSICCCRRRSYPICQRKSRHWCIPLHSSPSHDDGSRSPTDYQSYRSSQQTQYPGLSFYPFSNA
jgi:hypothetical protein